MHQDSPHLDGQYAAFGALPPELEAVDEIAATPTDMRDRPKADMRIRHIEIVDEGEITEPERCSAFFEQRMKPHWGLFA
jgi:peptidyl-prolyl cis-trans isomerase B (cyclophilin B)